MGTPTNKPQAAGTSRVIEGKFDELKGKAKRIWAELTDDDFLKAEGSVDKLVGKIKQRVGATEQDIKSRLELH